MAARQQQPQAEPFDPGTFVSTIPVGYVNADPAERRRIDEMMRALPQTEISRPFLHNLLMIKTLAPEQSRDLLVLPVPMVVDFVKTLKEKLVATYYHSR